MIEYESVAHAEAALNRTLSNLELKWFEWTANVSNFNLYMMNFVFLLIIYTLAPLPSFFLDVYKVRSFEKYKLQPGVHNTKSAAIKCYKDTMMLFFFVVAPLNVLSYPTFKILGISSGIPLPSFQTALLQLVTYFIIEDYTNYWLHRWLHSDWGYNNIHRIHHEFTAPQSWASAYSHFAELLVLGIPTFLGPAMCPGHIITFYLWIALRQLEAIETHSGYDFPFSPTKLIPLYGGAEYHDYHHYIGGKSQSNFASVFTYCDWLYGTDKVGRPEVSQYRLDAQIPRVKSDGYQGYRYHKDLLRKTRKAKTSALNGSNDSPSYDNLKTTQGHNGTTRDEKDSVGSTNKEEPRSEKVPRAKDKIGECTIGDFDVTYHVHKVKTCLSENGYQTHEMESFRDTAFSRQAQLSAVATLAITGVSNLGPTDRERTNLTCP